MFLFQTPDRLIRTPPPPKLPQLSIRLQTVFGFSPRTGDYSQEYKDQLEEDARQAEIEQKQKETLEKLKLQPENRYVQQMAQTAQRLTRSNTRSNTVPARGAARR